MFKNYEKEYENVYTSDRTLKKCDLNNISCHNNIPENISLYIAQFKESARGYDLAIFNNLVKLFWLSRRYVYKNRLRKGGCKNGFELDASYGVFMKYYVGYDSLTFMSSNAAFGKIIGYMLDFFPGFDEGNPFIDNYEYPYSYMNFPCLFLVYQMEERMSLLAYGDAHKMNYAEFIDYIINYVNCYDDEIGFRKYEVIQSNNCPVYVKDMTNKQKTWKKKKRKKRKNL